MAGSTSTSTPTADAADDAWWRTAVIYQIYIRSFADGDGDGLGDLIGIRSRLEHLHDIGVDALWLTPFYPSPQVDGGYDVADYRDVDPRFGTLADLDRLVSRAHELGIRVIIDIVPNHTSSQHPWFLAATKSKPGSRERNRYLFREGRGPDGAEPPNDWRSTFHGSAWTRIVEPDGSPGQWYLHLFSDEQPDLDWTNAEVRAEFVSILRFWFDRGIDGFRIDVAHGIAKDPAMPDLDGRFGPSRAPSDPLGRRHPHWDVDEVHDVYKEWRRVSDSYEGDRVFVGEVWLTPDRVAGYLGPDELHTAFNFEFLQAPWDPTLMRTAIDTSMDPLREVGATATWVLSNHDVRRHVTRYGGGEQGVRRARAAALLMLALPGGAYIYQGEELGLAEVLDLPPESRADPVFFRSGGGDLGRDGCRVPIPWSGDEPPFGFGPAGAWLPQPQEWAGLTVQHEREDPSSMLNLYRDCLRLRRETAGFGDGTMEWLESNADVIAFRRDEIVCVVNMGSEPAEAPAACRLDADGATSQILLASGPTGADGQVPADTAVWYRVTT